MFGQVRLLYKSAALILLLALGVTVMAADKKPAKPSGKGASDPPGTAPYMSKLRALFTVWDQNKDGMVDKTELARIFRGTGAKPFDYVPPGKAKTDEPSTTDPAKPATPVNPNYTRFPDYNVLVQLDTNKDEMISQEEFLVWAREYASQLKEQTDLVNRLKQTQTRLGNKGKVNPKDRQRLQNELKRDEEAIRKLRAKMKNLERQVQKDRQNDRKQPQNKNKKK